MTTTTEYDAKRRAERPWRRWYWSAAWSKLRHRKLWNEPLCRMCKANGLLNDGSRNPDGSVISDPKQRKLIVDHIKPHRGDADLFFDYTNLMVLCKRHHDSAKQAAEKSTAEARGVDGWPIE